MFSTVNVTHVHGVAPYTISVCGMLMSDTMKPLREFPRTRKELFDYDVIILGDADWRTFSKTSPQESKEITPTQKIRRRIVEQSYSAEIEAMYAAAK